MISSISSGEHSRSIIESAQKAYQDEKLETNLHGSVQERKALYYQQELDRMKQAIQDLQTSSHEESPQQLQSSVKNQSDASPLRNEFKQNQWQEEVLQEENQQEQDYNLEENNTDHRLERTESIINEHANTIQPKYIKSNSSFPQLYQYSGTVQSAKEQQSKEVKKDVTSKTLKSKKSSKVINQMLNKKLQHETNAGVKKKSNPLKAINRECEIMTVGQKYQQEKVVLKENGKGFFENVYSSDLCFQHMVNDQEIQDSIQRVKKQVSRELGVKKKDNDPMQIFRAKQKAPHCQNDVQERRLINRCEHDEIQIKLFGRHLPCQECLHFLNKGQSSELCGFHGKRNGDLPASKQLSKRFQKYI